MRGGDGYVRLVSLPFFWLCQRFFSSRGRGGGGTRAHGESPPNPPDGSFPSISEVHYRCWFAPPSIAAAVSKGMASLQRHSTFLRTLSCWGQDSSGDEIFKSGERRSLSSKKREKSRETSPHPRTRTSCVTPRAASEVAREGKKDARAPWLTTSTSRLSPSRFPRRCVSHEKKTETTLFCFVLLLFSVRLVHPYGPRPQPPPHPPPLLRGSSHVTR